MHCVQPRQLKRCLWLRFTRMCGHRYTDFNAMVIMRLSELSGATQLSVLGHLGTKDWSRIEHPPSLIVALIRKRKQMGQVMNQR